MTHPVIQTSFAWGELSSALFARVDLKQYAAGAALMRNFFVDYRGGASNFPGTTFVGQCFDNADEVRLIPFARSTIQTYVLELGNHYLRVITNGAYLTDVTYAITGANNSVNCQLQVPGHTFNAGDWVAVEGVGGMTELNGRTFSISFAVPDFIFISDILTGLPIDSTNYGVYTSGGTASRIYHLTAPWAAADLPLLKYTQSVDVMTVTHPDYVPYDISRTSPTTFSVAARAFGTSMTAPTNVVVTPSTAGTTTYVYVVTAVNAAGEESLQSVAGQTVASAIMSTTPTAHVSLTWDAVSGALYYNIYRYREVPNGSPAAGAVFGFIGTSNGNAFTDVSILPNFSITPPIGNNPFTGGNNPACANYFQQRMVLGSTEAGPQTLYGSQPGAPKNFDYSNPIKEDDSFEVTLNSGQVNVIKHLVYLTSGLLVLTESGAWQISGGAGATSAVTPINILAQPQAYNGISDVPPIVVNDSILYVQARGSIVRNITYNFYTNIYTGTDISVFSEHLFTGFQIKEWAYAEEPFKLIWAVREDGLVLVLTYMKEQEIQGWAWGDTRGYYQSVCSVVEGDENAVYFVVRRFVGAVWVNYVERLATRIIHGDASLGVFSHCALMNTLTAGSGTLTPIAINGNIHLNEELPLAVGDVVTLRSSVPNFSSSTVGASVRFANGLLTVTIQQTNTDILAEIVNIPDSILATTDWTCTEPISVATNLWHLEGCIVKILADGNVRTDATVENGSVAITPPAATVIVGLGYTSQLQTLRIDTGEPTTQGKRKKIPAVTIRVKDTRGLFAGMTFDTLTEFKMRDAQPMGDPIALETGDQRIVLDPLWATEGQICIQQDYPLPATVLGVIPEVVVGDT